MEEMREVKSKLALLGRTQKELARTCGIDYGRFAQCVNGFQGFTVEEERIIRRTLSLWLAAIEPGRPQC